MKALVNFLTLYSYKILHFASVLSGFSSFFYYKIYVFFSLLASRKNLPIRNHSPFVIKSEISPPSSDFNIKSSWTFHKSRKIKKRKCFHLMKQTDKIDDFLLIVLNLTALIRSKCHFKSIKICSAIYNNIAWYYIKFVFGLCRNVSFSISTVC